MPMSMPDFLRERLIAQQQRDEQHDLDRRAHRAVAEEAAAQAAVARAEERARERAAQMAQAEALGQVIKTAAYLGPLLAGGTPRSGRTSIVHRKNRFGNLKPLVNGATLIHKYTGAQMGSPSISAQRDGLYT